MQVRFDFPAADWRSGPAKWSDVPNQRPRKMKTLFVDGASLTPEALVDAGYDMSGELQVYVKSVGSLAPARSWVALPPSSQPTTG